MFVGTSPFFRHLYRYLHMLISRFGVRNHQVFLNFGHQSSDIIRCFQILGIHQEVPGLFVSSGNSRLNLIEPSLSPFQVTLSEFLDLRFWQLYKLSPVASLPQQMDHRQLLLLPGVWQQRASRLECSLIASCCPCSNFSEVCFSCSFFCPICTFMMSSSDFSNKKRTPFEVRLCL